MDISGLTTLKKIVLKSIHRKKPIDMSYYKANFGFAIDAMTQLHLFTVKENRMQWLTMDAVNCVNLPSDYLSFIKLGVPIGGRLWSFSLDNDVIIPTSMENGLETLNSDRGEGVSAVQGKFNPDGTSVPYNNSGYNSTGGHNNYNFGFDLENRRLVLDGIDRSQVLLVYKSNGVSASGDTLVPVVYSEAILSYVNWRRSEGDGNASWMQMYKNEFYEECSKIRFLESPSVEALYDAIYSTYRQTVKR